MLWHFLFLFFGSHRFSIKGRIYPAILPAESKKVAGLVIMGVTDEELQVLDAFEDVEYTRTRVEISLVVCPSHIGRYYSMFVINFLICETLA